MHEKTGHDNKGMSGHGFTFPVGGSVPVIFISMGAIRVILRPVDACRAYKTN
jgi:hypothetical protein